MIPPRPRLTPAEIRAIRVKHHCNRARFAKYTKIGAATLARWESGDLTPTAALDHYLRLLNDPAIFSLVARRTLNQD